MVLVRTSPRPLTTNRTLIGFGQHAAFSSRPIFIPLLLGSVQALGPGIIAGERFELPGLVFRPYKGQYFD
jgi:hypothetical protein